MLGWDGLGWCESQNWQSFTTRTVESENHLLQRREIAGGLGNLSYDRPIPVYITGTNSNWNKLNISPKEHQKN